MKKKGAAICWKFEGESWEEINKTVEYFIKEVNAVLRTMSRAFIIIDA